MDIEHDDAEALREAWAELRQLPLGGRGHLADACLDGAAEIERLRTQLAGAVEALRELWVAVAEDDPDSRARLDKAMAEAQDTLTRLGGQ